MPDKVYRFSRAWQSVFLKVVSTWRVEGAENVPPRGPLLVVANHLSNMDPPLLMCSVPRRLYFLAKRGLFKPGLAQFFNAVGAFPVDRDEGGLAGFNWCRRILARDGAVCLFPEATRSRRAGMQKAVSGVALLALRTQAPILPIGITGTQHLGAIHRCMFFPTGNLTVRIGQPFSLPLIEGRLQREQLDALTTMIMQRVAMLLPAEYHGVYQLHQPNPTSERRQ